MTPTDLDTRARRAAAAAHTAVAPAVAEALLRTATAPTSPPRRRRAPLALAAAALVAVVVGVALLLGGDRGATQVVADGPPAPDGATSVPATTPAFATTTPPAPAVTRPPPGRLPLPWELKGSSLITTGTTTEGRPFGLSYGGPSNELCLDVVLGDGVAAGACAGLPYGQALPPEQVTVPTLVDDVRIRRMVFGRLAEGVVAAEVELAGGTTTTRTPAIPSERGPVYAIELPAGAHPVAVVGHLADGTTVRYVVPPREPLVINW